MNSSGWKQQSRILEIDKAQPLSVHLPVGSAVRCIAGQVWLTQEGLLDDVVLAAGEEFVVRGGGLIVMSGLGGSALAYLSAADRPPARGALTGDFLDAAKARAGELRRAEWSRLSGLAWRFLQRALARTKSRLNEIRSYS